MTTISVCDDRKALFTKGLCPKPEGTDNAIRHLWFAYALDVCTDLAGMYSFGALEECGSLIDIVMCLPFSITWNLRLPKAQKIGIFVIFGSGWVCILFATLRVVQVGLVGGVPAVPEWKWLQIWTVIETSMGMFLPPPLCRPAC
jgi:hypothetical protein